MLGEVLEYLPDSIRKIINEWIQRNIEITEKIEEIRIRNNGTLSVKIEQELINLCSNVSSAELRETFENICEKSIYSYTKQISEGFITIRGGNRVGITGTAVMENNNLINLNYVSSLNFRIARQIKDASLPILKHIINIQNKNVYNTIIASPPGGGKTTILRDLTRKISNRNARNRIPSKNMWNCR